MSSTLVPSELMDPTEPAVAARLATLLSLHRHDRGWSRRRLARLSDGRWSSKELKAVEAGQRPIDQALLSDLAALYEVDVTAVLPQRTALFIDQGLLSIGGVGCMFDIGDVDSLLKSYLLLVRRIRGQEKVAILDLRRSDIEALASNLGIRGEEVTQRLGELMGVSASQRRAMAMMFTTGMAVIVLTAGVVGTASRNSGSNTSVPATGARARTDLSVIAPASGSSLGPIGQGSDLAAETAAEPLSIGSRIESVPVPTATAAEAVTSSTVASPQGIEPLAPRSHRPVPQPVPESADGGADDLLPEDVAVADPVAPAAPTVAVGEPVVPGAVLVAVAEPVVAPVLEVAVGLPPVASPQIVDVADPPTPSVGALP